MWIKLPYAATDLKSAQDDKELPRRWVEAMARELNDSWSSPHPWFSFSAGRIRARRRSPWRDAKVISNPWL